MRVRLRYAERGKVRFLSHRDLARVWERAIRKAELPIAYSEGFSPRPRLHFGLALSVGHESDAEFLDIDLRTDVDVSDLPRRLTPCLPDGVDVTAAAVVADNEAALQAVVTSVTWSFDLDCDVADARDRLERLLARDEVLLGVQRKGKEQQVDLRPLILEASILDASVSDDAEDPGVRLRVDLATSGRSVRPAELLAAFEPPLRAERVCRLEQWMNIDGVRRPPLPADPSHSPTARAAG
jgi:radical SAM-linked protein